MDNLLYTGYLTLVVFMGITAVIIIFTNRIQEDIQRVLNVVSHIESQNETIINQ